MSSLAKMPAYLAPDPAAAGHQLLENLATGYWYSQVLFTALELDIFSRLAAGTRSTAQLASVLTCKEDELYRLLRALEGIQLIARYEDCWMNSVIASRYLVQDQAEYLGDFLLYRKYMQENWQQLTEKIQGQPKKEPELAYRERNFRYVRAMDRLVQQKALEIAGLCLKIGVPGPLLDVGGGAGTLLRSIREQLKNGGRQDIAFSAELFDLPEVIDAARQLYPEQTAWEGIELSEGDFRSHHFPRRYGCVILSNFLHAYGAAEARVLLAKAVDLLAEGGGILIHDYFPDYSPAVPEKGALYDLCMMQNTFNGACHEMKTIRRWLTDMSAGASLPVSTFGLTTDSAVMLIGGPPEWHNLPPVWEAIGQELGFDRISQISPSDVVTAPWVAQKCRFGCRGFGGNLQCPPYSPGHEQTREILDCYTTAILVQGQPPGKNFHEQLLALEREAFLAGYHKALVYGAGPCTLCPECAVDEACRQPGRARPAMEACGIDVYETVHKAGWDLNVVRDKSAFVKYIGLLLVE